MTIQHRADGTPGAAPTMPARNTMSAEHGVREGEGGHPEEGDGVRHVVDRRLEDLDDPLHDEGEQAVLEERAMAPHQVDDQLPEEERKQGEGEEREVERAGPAAQDNAHADEQHVPEEERTRQRRSWRESPFPSRGGAPG